MHQVGRSISAVFVLTLGLFTCRRSIPAGTILIGLGIFLLCAAAEFRKKTEEAQQEHEKQEAAAADNAEKGWLPLFLEAL